MRFAFPVRFITSQSDAHLQEQSRGLIFIGHSYGGLLIKEVSLSHNGSDFSNFVRIGFKVGS